MIWRLFLLCVACLVCLAGQKVGNLCPLTDRYGWTVQAGCWGKLVFGWVVWETRGQHRRLSPKNQCGHFQALLPRAQVGRDVVEEKEEEEEE